MFGRKEILLKVFTY